jgi:hypothetical protein
MGPRRVRIERGRLDKGFGRRQLGSGRLRSTLGRSHIATSRFAIVPGRLRIESAASILEVADSASRAAGCAPELAHSISEPAKAFFPPYALTFRRPRQRSSPPLRVAHQRLRDQKIPFGIFQRAFYAITNVFVRSWHNPRIWRFSPNDDREHSTQWVFPYAGGARSSFGRARRVL